MFESLNRSRSLVLAGVFAAFLAGCASSSRAPAPVEDRGALASRPAPVAVEQAATPAKVLPGAENAGKPGYYTVKPGDTLVRIALENGQNWRDLVRWNTLENPNVIEVGQVLRVAPPVAVGEDDVAWAWPVSGTLIAGYDEVKNKGLDLAGKAGDAVVAAADGRVVYAGAGLRGYGNLIILKHNNTYLSAYAHNQTLLVKEDQSVRKGQKIAEMGNSDADRVKLHFEIRRQGKPVDPAKYLPAR
jgi:lipoprotein NlpD